jgi:hypothetical protein
MDTAPYARSCRSASAQLSNSLQPGENCTALVATLEGGYEVLITDGGDMVGSLTPLSQRDGSEGFAIGVYPLDADGCWGGDEPPGWVDEPAAVVGTLPDLVLRALQMATRG